MMGEITLSNNPERVSELVDVFANLTEEVEQRKNKRNNQLLKTRAETFIDSGKADFWRFVCLPKTEFNQASLDWNVDVDVPRYDNLTPAIPMDLCVVNAMRSKGLEPSITLVVDDLEAPLIRSDNKLTGSNPFKSLTPNERQLAIDNLSAVRDITSEWIMLSTLRSGIDYKLLFFTEFLGYEEFIDGVNSISMDLDSKDFGIIRAEEDFIKKADAYKSSRIISSIARTRVSQYAYEGMLLADKFPSSIFLDFEYPVIPVWKKLTMFADIPTLFYATDQMVRKI